MVKRKSWQRYEKRTAKKHRGKHLGGPGQPDYIRGDTEGEVKLRQRPMTKTELMEECRKGRTEVVCSAGFSESAKEYIRRYRPDVKLISGK